MSGIAIEHAFTKGGARKSVYYKDKHGDSLGVVIDSGGFHICWDFDNADGISLAKEDVGEWLDALVNLKETMEEVNE